MRFRFIALFGLAIVLNGCGHARPGGGDERLPGYSIASADRVREILWQRAQEVHTLSTRCDFTLSRRDGQSIRLDGLLVMEPPDRLRIRTFKFGQAVFDLTILPGGVWVETPGDPEKARQVIPATRNTGELARQLLWFSGTFFEPGGIGDGRRDGRGDWIFRRPMPSGGQMVCYVDGKTLTPRRYELVDEQGQARFELKLSRYALVDGVPWPRELDAVAMEPGKGATGAGERVEISLSEIRINQAIGRQAFVPPPHAERRP